MAQALRLSQVARPARRCSLGLCASRSFFFARNGAICVAPTGVSEQWARHKVAEPLLWPFKGPLAQQPALAPCKFTQVRGVCHALNLDNCNSSEGREQIRVLAMKELTHIYYEQHGRRSHNRFAQVGMTVQFPKQKVRTAGGSFLVARQLQLKAVWSQRKLRWRPCGGGCRPAPLT